MLRGEESTVVATEPAGEIIGFGSIVPAEGCAPSTGKR
jgi:hypothetical protein